jgi:inhibitor of KinA sporulation pathway (predicted exonuclease)
MEKVKIKINDFEDKKSSAGVRYTLFDTSQGKMSCWDEDLIKSLKKEIGKSVNVDTTEKGDFVNIRALYKDVIEVEEEKVGIGKTEAPTMFKDKHASMYVSYAKDIFLALMPVVAEEMKNTKSAIAYDLIMSKAIELVKQARKEFE